MLKNSTKQVYYLRSPDVVAFFFASSQFRSLPYPLKKLIYIFLFLQDTIFSWTSDGQCSTPISNSMELIDEQSWPKSIPGSKDSIQKKEGWLMKPGLEVIDS